VSQIKTYMGMYHESSVANLLEIMLYHRTDCESSEDGLVELIDYCYRKFLKITEKADYYMNLQKNARSAKDAKDILK